LGGHIVTIAYVLFGNQHKILASEGPFLNLQTQKLILGEETAKNIEKSAFSSKNYDAEKF
jgi:hypothetical protein